MTEYRTDFPKHKTRRFDSRKPLNINHLETGNTLKRARILKPAT